MPEFRIVSEIKISMPKYVPFELQIKIMKGLPIKSLIKFRSVSKPWKTFIDSPEFITDYRNHHTHHQILLYEPRRVYIIDDDDHDSFSSNKSVVEVPLKLHTSRIIGYSQGLFGFYDYNYPTYDAVAIIWNPSIRKSIKIPLPNLLDYPYKTDLGFGVCNATDPMIVKINFIDSNDSESISSIPSQVEVFKLSTRKWISLSDTARLPRRSLKFCKKVLVTERFIYWLVYDRTPDVDGLNYPMIVSFDLNSERFTEIRLPYTLATRFGSLELSKLGESLLVAEQHLCIDGLEASVWMLMDHGTGQNCFKKLYTIKAPCESIEKILGFRKNGQPIIRIYSDSDKSKILVVCEPDYEYFKDIWISVIGYYDVKCSCIYTGTLLLLDH